MGWEVGHMLERGGGAYLHRRPLPVPDGVTRPPPCWHIEACTLDEYVTLQDLQTIMGGPLTTGQVREILGPTALMGVRE